MSWIGYARISSKKQNIERQIEKLKECELLFKDEITGAVLERPGLTKMLEFIREGDIVVVSELDRLGRNNEEIQKILKRISEKKPHLKY
ncbi:recombinase family protein [Erysipelothrix aquatica]|uniref:recombinase family protein n=1 Tax=Erysipelothrix aquatica TaxID=2683714 RepID=UPI0019160A6B|nr:recombinase family protein [Erysipelothrix aquatica]